MELGSIIGLVLGFLAVVLGILIGGDMDFGVLGAFGDAVSFMIVIVGAIGAVLIGYPLPTFIATLKSMGKIMKLPDGDAKTAIIEIVDLANLARREGILALEEKAQSMTDPFLKKGIMLIVDGTDPELVRSILETEMNYIEERHIKIAGAWEFIKEMAPAWGMLGTMIGLVLMLLDLSDPDMIGPNMAVALLTTLYGGLVANYVAGPVAVKLKFFNAEEMLLKEILVEGMLSIQAGENPRIIEEKLKSFLSPAIRETIAASGGE